MLAAWKVQQHFDRFQALPTYGAGPALRRHRWPPYAGCGRQAAYMAAAVLSSTTAHEMHLLPGRWSSGLCGVPQRLADDADDGPFRIAALPGCHRQRSCRLPFELQFPRQRLGNAETPT